MLLFTLRCRYHLRELLQLDVAPSTIPEAGQGLFSLSNRSKGDRIVAYTGESLSVSALEKRYPKGDVGVYCLAISSSVFIDSALSRGVGASANASRNGAKPNAKFVLDVRGGSARLEATRCIRAGDEVFVSYGREYWCGAKSCSHSTTGVPDWEWDLSDPFAAAPATPRIEEVSSLPAPVCPPLSTTPTSMSSSAPVLPPTLVPVPPIAPAQPPSMDSPVIRQDPPFELLVEP